MVGVPPRLLPLIREGHPADTIVACAEAEKADLVVVGSNGASHERRGLGAISDLVSSHCPCNVLIVKSGGC